MYELIKISDSDYYIESPTRIGVIRLNETDVCLIDSGFNKDVGKRVKKILDQNGWNLKSIYVTHAHSDHIGANKYLQEQTGCKIYANGMDCDLTNHTILGTSLLYGGCPFDELKHRLLYAPESKAEPLTENVLPTGFKILNLSGHTADMVGYITPDNTVFLADALCSAETVDKYKITYIYNVEDYLKTLERIKSLKANVFIPCHIRPSDNITDLAQYNIIKVYEVADTILKICKSPVCFEELLQKLFQEYNIKMNQQQYLLIGSTVRSYLSWLKESEKIETVIENCKILWRTK